MMKLQLAMAVALLALFTPTQVLTERPQASLEQGIVRGKVVESSATGKTFQAFQGIPYAKPPVGKLRFKDPEPPEPWDGVLDRMSEGAECIQVGLLGDQIARGEEDCLFLNVYTTEVPRHHVRSVPADSSVPLKPVMVWIHGGAFIVGSGNTYLYGPDYLVDRGVLVVTINYRLGVLGFLSLYDPEIPGNMGLKDQVAALRWVQQNIAAFGGDPNSVTIFGESAGSASVHLLMLSPLAKGLFQRAICQSGSALNPWAFKRSVRNNTKVLAERVGCEELEPKALAACLRKLPASRLAAVSFSATTPEDDRLGIPLSFAPTVDGSFLLKEPRELLEAGEFHKVEFLAGSNTGEGLLVLNAVTAHQEKLKIFNEDFERFVPGDLNLPAGSDETREVADKLKNFYFDGKPLTKKNLDHYKDMSTDRLFLLGIHQTFQIQAKFTDKPMYMYEMAFEGKFGFFKPFIGTTSLKGVSHADEMGYLWYMGLFPLILPSSSPEMRTLDRMVTMWTNFAKTGDSTPETTELLPVRWRPYSDSDPAYLLIEKEPRVDTHIEKSRMDLWDSIYVKYGNSKG